MSVEKKIKSGVYAVKCMATKRCYIDWSMDVVGRLRVFKNDLRKGRGNKFILDDFKKHGEEKFQFNIAERCLESRLLNATKEYCLTVIENGWTLYNENIIIIERNKSQSNQQNDTAFVRQINGAPKIELQPFDKFRNRKLECADEDEWSEIVAEIDASTEISQKQKDLLKSPSFR